MAEFDFDGLTEFLAGGGLAVVVAERDTRTSSFKGHALELDADTVEAFRGEAIKHVRGLASRELLEHQEQTLLATTQDSPLRTRRRRGRQCRDPLATAESGPPSEERDHPTPLWQPS